MKILNRIKPKLCHPFFSLILLTLLTDVRYAAGPMLARHTISARYMVFLRHQHMGK